jgi:hypothetical protein
MSPTICVSLSAVSPRGEAEGGRMRRRADGGLRSAGLKEGRARAGQDKTGQGRI